MSAERQAEYDAAIGLMVTAGQMAAVTKPGERLRALERALELAWFTDPTLARAADWRRQTVDAQKRLMRAAEELAAAAEALAALSRPATEDAR